MASKKSPKPARTKAISEEADFWLQQFQKHFKFSFLDRCDSLPNDSNDADIRRVLVEAVVDTLLDSGIDAEQIIDGIGAQLTSSESQPLPWNSALNDRRITLIDKELTDEATFDERIELSRLTLAMRRNVDDQRNLPSEGAHDLLRKLRRLDST